MTTAGGSFFGATAMGNIRNPLQEAVLLPGVAFGNDQAIVVNGMPSNSETVRIDGQESTSTIWKVLQQNSQGSVDAIQEVAVPSFRLPLPTISWARSWTAVLPARVRRPTLT
jgi:hypothetical protein